MKTTISYLIFLFIIAGVTAQEMKTTHNTKVNNDISLSEEGSKSDINISLEEDVCHAELSKVTFYEALIRQNGFKINLKKSKIIVLKNTEDIITNNKERISYSE